MKHPLCDVGATRRLDHVRRDCQVVVEEIAEMRVVLVNTANPRGGE